MERLYKILWPGPGRLKVKRCLLLAFFIGVTVIVLTIGIHFWDDQDGVRHVVTNVNEGDIDGRRQVLIDLKKQRFKAFSDASNQKFSLEYVKGKGYHSTGRTEKLQPSLFNFREGNISESYELQTEIEFIMTHDNAENLRTTLQTVSRSDSKLKVKQSIPQIPGDWNMVPTIGYKAANFIVVQDGGIKPLIGESAMGTRHLMILGHYEQLGKTTVNYMLAARLAFLMNRKIVKPFVADSRFCGLRSGWTGTLRSGTRTFKPLDLYYNISSLQSIFSQMSLANMEYLESFKDSCSFTKNGRKIVIIYLWYQGNYHSKYLMLSDSKLAQIKQVLDRSSGWVDCSFLNSHLKLDKRIGKDMKAGKQYCVNPEKIFDWEILENNILKNDPCVVFHQWRGIGYQRSHFNITIDLPPENLLKLIKPSKFVIAEVKRSLKLIGQGFVGIHIRSERQLLWYGIEKWLKCMNLVYQEAQKIANARSMKVFISSDIGSYGSDQLSSNLNKNQLKVINAKYNWLVKKLNAITYSVLRPRHYIWTDRGLVALIQLHILSQASFLITLGAGTFQRWITDTFKDRRESYGDKKWTITKVCYSELKNWQERKHSKKAVKPSPKS